MHLLPYAHCVATALVCTPPSSLPSCPMCCSQTENGNIRCSALKFNDSNKSTDPRQRLTRLLSVASLSRKHVRACQAFFFLERTFAITQSVHVYVFYCNSSLLQSAPFFYFFLGFLSSTADAVLLERPCLSTAPFSSTAKLLERKRDDSFFFFFCFCAPATKLTRSLPLLFSPYNSINQ